MSISETLKQRILERVQELDTEIAGLQEAAHANAQAIMAVPDTLPWTTFSHRIDVLEFSGNRLEARVRELEARRDALLASSLLRSAPLAATARSAR